MSGFFDEAITPCPSRSRSSGFGDQSGSETFDSLMDGDIASEPTGQIEYTTEVRVPTLTGVRPRRANRAGSTFQIHDDIVEKPAGPVEKRRRPNGATQLPSDRKSSLLAQPAQRFRPKVNFAPSPPPRTVKPETETQRNSRVGAKQALSAINTNDRPSKQDDNENGLKKHLRRNTVYIPPDDTTVASVFMGLFSPLKKTNGDVLPQVVEDTQINTLEARIAKRQARKSSVVSARRAPLQPSTKIAQEAAIRVDIAGKNGGKENIPPGALVDIEKKKAAQSTLASKPNRASIVSTSKLVGRSIETAEPAVDPPRKQVSKRAILGEKQNNAQAASYGSNAFEQSRRSMSASHNARASALSDRLGRGGSSRASKTESAPSKLRELNYEYPKLTEDIAKPALYDDNWLSHQETVITQLVNALFEYTNGENTAYDPSALRLELLELYHTDYFTQLYERLQASISCGTLSIPKDIISRNARLKQDLGLKRKFLDIWIHSYDLRALIAAVETIVARKVSNDSIYFELGTDIANNSITKRGKMAVRKLEGFLEAFLLRNDDIDPSLPGARDTPAEMQAQAYRRTVLRSIVLVILLDQGRQHLGTALPRRLFLRSSVLKSSAEVLQALARILLPSCGDIVKPLNHLGCRLSYKQHQLQEYDYQMNNLAVDLRDGVRLTRIVETLFYMSEHMRPAPEDQTKITLCSGEALSLLGDETDLPLSKHLKYPCASRAAKIFNVQVALSALDSVKGSRTIIGSVRPEDIVDGYREKTVALLWALVSKWGLAGLVDWADLDKEILRLKRKLLSRPGHEKSRFDGLLADHASAAEDEHAQKLQQWAALLAAPKGLRISNMTSSFADGKIYGSIVDEYEPYITGSPPHTPAETAKSLGFASLGSRLQLLGCSSQFAHLVSPGAASSHVLDYEFTLGALAFLCSRLLSVSKRARAATILQRAWRARLTERDALRRTVAKNLATHCATVVQTRNEILWAKE
ncbi:uncharacterized protein N7459_002552, partial [Penicillium hispanicum]|uniref:uncharacterized protein n=1 Tax=Penicillium hispanicum TaxID=1080232 RepID=UPI0025409A42